jgi:aldehyde dehydrogenase (NAD+)
LPSYRLWIDGQWRDPASGARFDTVNPFTGQPWASAPG